MCFEVNRCVLSGSNRIVMEESRVGRKARRGAYVAIGLIDLRVCDKQSAIGQGYGRLSTSEVR